MTWGQLLSVIAVLSLGLGMSLSASGQVSRPIPAPTQIEVDDTPTAIVRPKRGRQVAVLSIELHYEAGKITSARLLSSKRIASAAPKVFARKGGDWLVTIEGDRPRSFFVSDPGWKEAEPVPKEDKGYEWVAQSGMVDWQLIIPLYVDGKAIEAHAITIREVRTNNVILRTNL